MSELSDAEREQIFITITNSFSEYSKKDISNFLTIKPKIISLLKSHKPMKLTDYQYALSSSNKPHERLIIFEFGNRSDVREYSLRPGGRFYCCQKQVKTMKCNSSSLQIKCGVVFIPRNHECQKRKLETVMAIQELIKQGKKRNAYTLCCRQKDQDSSPSQYEPLPMEIISRTNSSFSEETAEFSTTDSINNFFYQTKSEPDTDETAYSLCLQPSEFDGDVETIENTKANLKSEMSGGEANFCIPPIKKPRLEETFLFDHPSASLLRSICEKLKIEYSIEAYRFWGNISFQNIVSNSSNIQLHEFKTNNIFACFSLFFTGDVEDCFRIQHFINSAFSEKLKATGKATLLEIKQAFSNNTITNELLEFMAEFLECCIGIYENGILKKYGKWNSESTVFTMILSFENGMYSVVLDL